MQRYAIGFGGLAVALTLFGCSPEPQAQLPTPQPRVSLASQCESFNKEGEKNACLVGVAKALEQKLRAEAPDGVVSADTSASDWAFQYMMLRSILGNQYTSPGWVAVSVPEYPDSYYRRYSIGGRPVDRDSFGRAQQRFTAHSTAVRSGGGSADVYRRVAPSTGLVGRASTPRPAPSSAPMRAAGTSGGALNPTPRASGAGRPSPSSTPSPSVSRPTQYRPSPSVSRGR